MCLTKRLKEDRNTAIESVISMNALNDSDEVSESYCSIVALIIIVKQSQ
jgi:hypothetical protein